MTLRKRQSLLPDLLPHEQLDSKDKSFLHTLCRPVTTWGTEGIIMGSLLLSVVGTTPTDPLEDYFTWCKRLPHSPDLVEVQDLSVLVLNKEIV